MKKLVCCDFDGTLLDSGGKLSAVTKGVLARLNSDLVEFVVATGRNKEFALRGLEGASNIRYLVVLNGAEVHDLYENKVVTSAKLNVDTINFFYKLAKKYSVNLKFSTQGLTYFNSLEKAGDKKFYICERKHKQFFETHDISGCVYYDNDYDKMSKILDIVKGVEGVEVPYYSRVILNSSVVNSDRVAAIDISAKGVSKGSAVQFLQNKLEISAENCIAIGDEINDLSMFKHVGHAVVVQNAANEIKAVANEIIGANYEHGVAKFLTQFIKA